jgi:hypothetical protein
MKRLLEMQLTFSTVGTAAGAAPEFKDGVAINVLCNMRRKKQANADSLTHRRERTG